MTDIEETDIEEIENKLRTQDDLVLRLTLLSAKAALPFSSIGILWTLIGFLSITNMTEFLLNFHIFNFYAYIFTDAIFWRKKIQTELNERAIKDIIE